MTSSPAPHNEPSNKQLRFFDAARLHARRFHKHPIASALRLLSADQRITHPDGGIALLTEVGHAIRATILFIATFVPTVVGMAAGIVFGQIVLTAIATPAAIISALLFAPRCERQIRARPTHDTTTPTWVLSGVATEHHRGIGDHLMREVERRADQAAVTVGLEVADINETAKQLYLEHGFEFVGRRADRLVMRRRPDPR